MLHFYSSHPIVTRGSRVSRAPLHHTLPAFLNLNGRSSIFGYFFISNIKAYQNKFVVGKARKLPIWSIKHYSYPNSNNHASEKGEKNSRKMIKTAVRS